MSADEYENYVNDLIKNGDLNNKLEFQTFVPDYTTIDAQVAVGAYIYMRDNGINSSSLKN